MTEEEKNEQQAAEESPDASPQEEEPAAEEAPAEEEAAPEEEPAAAEEPAEEEAAEGAEEEPQTPRQRRKLERSLHVGEARSQRTPEQRAEERGAERSRKAAQRRAWRTRSRERRKAGARGEPTPPAAKGTGKPKVRQGVVVSDKANKTITVRIDIQRAHRMYGKVVRTSSTLHAHDEANEAHVGDTVRVVESRPLSRRKRWRLVEVLERAR